mgnify:CR=1 FL=1
MKEIEVKVLEIDKNLIINKLIYIWAKKKYDWFWRIVVKQKSR